MSVTPNLCCDETKTEEHTLAWQFQSHFWTINIWGIETVLHFEVAAATAAKSLQLCPTLCDPIDGNPPGILQARTLEWVAISFSNAWKWKVKVKSLSRVRLFATPWTAAHQASPSMGFSRQEYWSGVPLPCPTSWSYGLKICKTQDLLARIWASWAYVLWCKYIIVQLLWISVWQFLINFNTLSH